MLADCDSFKLSSHWKTITKVVGGGYWILVIVSFAFDYNICLVLTVPWSYLVIGSQMHLPSGHLIVDILNNNGVQLLVFPIICGGLNVVVLVLIISLVCRISSWFRSV